MSSNCLGNGIFISQPDSTQRLECSELSVSIRCILSPSQAFLNNTELKIFGRHRESNPGPLVQLQAILGLIHGGDQIFLILYSLKKPVKEREYI